MATGSNPTPYSFRNKRFDSFARTIKQLKLSEKFREIINKQRKGVYQHAKC